MKKNSALSFALISAMLFTGLTGCGTDESSEETLNNNVSETAAETALQAGMTEQQVALLTGETEGYVVKFKMLELWEQLKLVLARENRNLF